MKAERFSAKVQKVDINPYVRVPVPIVRKLHREAGRQRGPIPVTGKLQGKAFSATVVRFRGLWRLYLNLVMRRVASVDVGDSVTVEVRLDPTSRNEPSPRMLTLALSKDKKASAVFRNLAPSRRKEILRYLNGLKRPESIERNVGKIMRCLRGKEIEGISLRPSTPADLAFITTLERHADNRDFIGQWTDAEHLSAMAGENRRSHSIIERDGKAEGYLIAYDRRAEGAGIYVKRILVDGKGRGTGTEGLRAFVEKAFAEKQTEFVWLLVRDWNERAKAVYRKLGFARFDLDEGQARRFNSAADAPKDSFRMILRRG